MEIVRFIQEQIELVDDTIQNSKLMEYNCIRYAWTALNTKYYEIIDELVKLRIMILVIAALYTFRYQIKRTLILLQTNRSLLWEEVLQILFPPKVPCRRAKYCFRDELIWKMFRCQTILKMFVI